MKVGDLVAYTWNAKERPEEVELAIVMDTDPYQAWPGSEYIQIYVLAVPEINPPLCVPRFKLDVINESR